MDLVLFPDFAFCSFPYFLFFPAIAVAWLSDLLFFICVVFFFPFFVLCWTTLATFGLMASMSTLWAPYCVRSHLTRSFINISLLGPPLVCLVYVCLVVEGFGLWWELLQVQRPKLDGSPYGMQSSSFPLCSKGDNILLGLPVCRSRPWQHAYMTNLKFPTSCSCKHFHSSLLQMSWGPPPLRNVHLC